MDIARKSQEEVGQGKMIKVIPAFEGCRSHQESNSQREQAPGQQAEGKRKQIYGWCEDKTRLTQVSEGNGKFHWLLHLFVFQHRGEKVNNHQSLSTA